MNIVYLVFGNQLEHYQQVYFSIYTSWIHKIPEDQIIVITENPALFTALAEKIEIVPINRTLIKEWEGKYNFFWRVKIKALELIAKKYPSIPILYLDGDTFFYQNPSPLRYALLSGQNYMHTNEGKLSALPTKTEKRMWRQMNGKTYNSVTINENSAMWNAGLIGIAPQNFGDLQLVTKINDAMLEDKVTRRLIEQFAFSLGLSQSVALQPADHIVGHYWGNKSQWNELIDGLMKEWFMKNYSFDQIVEQVESIDLTQYPIIAKESNTKKMLIKVVNDLIKTKNPVYVKNNSLK